VAAVALVACFALVAVAGVVGNNAWTSWVAVMVPARVRGRYFGARNARAALVGTVASVGVGALLDRAAAHGWETRALAWTSAGGATAGLVCSALMRRQHEPRRSAPRGASPRAVLAAFTDPRVRRLLAFQLLWSASTGVAGSLYCVHAIGTLGLGVTGLAIYNTALAATRMLATPLWGRVIDRAGPRDALVFCAMLSGIGSAIWVATGPGCAWPVAIDAVVSGVALGGIELAVFAMPLALSAPAATPGIVGGVALVAGLAFGAASVAGGAIVGAASPSAAPGVMRVIFAASAMGRLFASLLAACTV
jgi:Na+/melibiose symporter-like transporter